MELLPHDDLIEEILERLPPKSLFRFKSVSKQWKSTIESPFFQHNHLIHHRQKSKTQNLLMLITDYKVNPKIFKSIITLELESSICNNIPIPREYNLSTLCKNSIDGLVCLYNYRNSVVIFNPATRWYRTLPPSTYQQTKSSRDFNRLGFGKDEITGLYKPVWLYNSPKATICEVFDFNLNAWRFIEPSSPKRIRYWHDPVYVTGLLYWLTEKDEEKIKSVLSLDLHTETFKIVCKTPSRNFVICNLNDNLCGLDDFGHTEVIWSLNLEEKTWKKLYNIDLSKICPSFESRWCIVSPVAFMGENNKLMLFSYCGCLGFYKQRLMLYDRETISSHEVCIYDFVTSVCYFQTLISIL